MGCWIVCVFKPWNLSSSYCLNAYEVAHWWVCTWQRGSWYVPTKSEWGLKEQKKRRRYMKEARGVECEESAYLTGGEALGARLAPCWASVHWSWAFTRDHAWQIGANLLGQKERGGQVQSRMQLLLCGWVGGTVVFFQLCWSQVRARWVSESKGQRHRNTI